MSEPEGTGATPEVQPFTGPEWKERSESFTTEDLPRLKVTVEAFAKQTVQLRQECQQFVRLLGAITLAKAVPLQPVCYRIDKRWFTRLPQDLQLVVEENETHVLLAIKHDNKPRIILPGPGTNV